MIFLIGYRGTGKSTVARLLASQLGWEFRDADAVLEAKFGRSITDIFQKDGEAKFRAMEVEVLAELCKLSRVVVATGGGIVLREENRELMRRAGRIVWLTADLDTLWKRMLADAAEGRPRPALSVGGRAEIEELLRVREPLYRACAEFSVDTTGRTPEEIADEIAARIEV
jgi:shikimate kinase